MTSPLERIEKGIAFGGGIGFAVGFAVAFLISLANRTPEYDPLRVGTLWGLGLAAVGASAGGVIGGMLDGLDELAPPPANGEVADYGDRPSDD